MTKKTLLIFIIYFLAGVLDIQSQETLKNILEKYPNDSIYQNTNSVQENNCFTIDATQSEDEYNPNIEFQWNLKGEIKSGVIVEYCVKEFGIFDIKLTAYDKITKEQIRQEDSTFRIELAETRSFSMLDRKSLKLKEHYIYQAHFLNFNGLKNNERVVWKINDEIFEGNEQKYIFDKKGTYQITCYILNEQNKIKQALYEKFEIKNPK